MRSPACTSSAHQTHDSQLLRCQLPGLPLRRSLRSRVDYESLCLAICNVNWTQAFSQCRRFDDFITRFTNLLSCTKYVQLHRCQRLPRHIVHLLKTKKKSWTRAKCTGNISLFKTATRVARAALRQYWHNGEERLIYSNNRNLLCSYMNNAVTNNKSKTVQLCTNGTALTNIESCNAFLDVLSTNFCNTSNISLPICQTAGVFQLHTDRRSSCSTIMP